MDGLSGLDLLSGVSDELVGSCDNLKTAGRRRTALRFVLPAAAALLLALGVLLASGKLSRKPNGEHQALLPTESDSPTDVPATEVALIDPAPLRNDPDPFLILSNYDINPAMGHNDSFAYPNFFVYHGRVFNYYMHFNLIYPGDAFGWMGSKVVNITRNPLLPEYDGEMIPDTNYTAYEILQELTGSFNGAVYELKGYDPEYVLCRPVGGGEMQIYFTGSGVVSGADLLENRLHMRERIDSFVYEYAVRGKGVDDVSRNLDPEVYGPAITKLFDALDAAEWVENTRGDFDEVFHLHILLEDGMRMELVLIGNGMVYFANTERSAMLTVDTDGISELLALMRAGAGEDVVLPENDLEAQLDVCRSFNGVGSMVPDFIPAGFKIASISPEIQCGEDLMPESITRLNVTYQAVDKGAFIGLDVMSQEYFDSISWDTIERVVPAGEFTADDFSKSVLEKDGSDYWIYGAVSLDGCVIVATSNYIIDGEIGSQQGLEALIASMTDLLQAVGK